jgi:hypothetical protein
MQAIIENFICNIKQKSHHKNRNKNKDNEKKYKNYK